MNYLNNSSIIELLEIIRNYWNYWNFLNFSKLDTTTFCTLLQRYANTKLALIKKYQTKHPVFLISHCAANCCSRLMFQSFQHRELLAASRT